MSEDSKTSRVKYVVSFYDGTSAEAIQGPAAEVAFEREFSTSVVEIALQRRAEWLYFMAWKSTKSNQPFDEWIERVSSVDVEVTDDVPLAPVPSPGD
jgi:hypothetical protein